MHKRQWDTVLYEIAEDRAATSLRPRRERQACTRSAWCSSPSRATSSASTRGVYRFTRFPVSQLGHYMAAVLWPQVRRPDVVGVMSHQTALSIHELSDVNPARIHLTLPATVRLRREVPKVLVIHYADLAPDDVERVEGVPVTTPARSIRDAHASHLGLRSSARRSPTGGVLGLWAWPRLTLWSGSCWERRQADADPGQTPRCEVTPGRKRPAGPPPSAGVLARYAQAYARELGVAEGRVRAWIAYMIMAGALERASGAAGPRFIVKGGVALELRLRDRARATKDIDIVLRDRGG